MMKIYLDRSHCTAWVAPCETCFSYHYLGEEIRPNYCLLDMVDDGQPERTFIIKDKDGVDKILVVDDENWADVFDSWYLTWQSENPEPTVD